MIDPGRTSSHELPAPAFEGEAQRPAQSYWNESWERLRANRIGVFCGAVILVLALIAIAAPVFSQFLTHFDPTRQHLADNFRAPGHPYLLGTDELGRDTLTRLIYGGRVTLGVAFLTVALSLSLGTTVGLVAGYYGGWADDILMRVVDVFLAIPAIFLFILMSILFRPNAITLAAIIASVGWGGVARLVRGEVLSVKQRDFILATRSIGARDLRLIFRHLIEAALDFLGLGIQPPTASWGNMLTNAESYFFHSGWLVVFPGVTIFVTVLASNLFGNAVRDAFDPRLKTH